MAGSQTAWGLDVGVSSLKAIKLRKDGNRVTVEAFDVLEHDKFLTEPDVERDTMIRSTLQKFMAKYNVRRETVFISVPGSSAFARFVKLPPVETKKIPEIVRFEAIQQIPFPLEQVNWDFHTFQSPDSPDVEVGIFAMKKELVAQVMSNFQAVDLPVAGVQISPLAVYNAAAYDNMTGGKGTVVIDMGAEHTDLVIIDSGRLWLRTINIGGNHFTDALAKSFKQPFARAEQLKKDAATSKYQKQIYQAMRPIFADLVAEIQRSIGHYNSSHRDSRLEHIVAMGSPLKLPNLQKYMQQELKMDVTRIDSYSMANVEKAAAFTSSILSMTTAYGLAVQALGLAPINANLLPIEIARKMMWKRKTPWFIGSAAVVLLGVAALGGQYLMASSAFHSQEDKAAANDAAIAQAKSLVDDFNSVPNDFANEVTRIESQLKLADNRAFWPMVMADIYSALPQYKPGQASIVITDIQSDFYGALSTVATSTAAPSGQAGPAPAAPTGEGDTAAAPAGQPAVAKTEGPSDRGFLVTIHGYTSTGVPNTINTYKDALMNRAPLPQAKPGETLALPLKIAGNRPYYFSSTQDATYSGYRMKVANTAAPGASTGQDHSPWGNVKGAYWEMFIPDYLNTLGWKPPAPPAGMGGAPAAGFGGMGGGEGNAQPLGEIPALDIVAKPPKPMNGYYTFTLRFKVHIAG